MKFFSTLFGAEVQGPLERALDAARPADAVPPWQRGPDIAVDGLTAIGFSRSEDVMLLASQSGQQIIDVASGALIFRNDGADGLDPAALKATRLDHPGEERLDIAGLYGGALRNMTSDGWSVDLIAKGSEFLSLLHAPGTSDGMGRVSFGGAASFHLLARDTEQVRVFGFSWTGRALVLATPGVVRLWTRPAPLTLG